MVFFICGVFDDGWFCFGGLEGWLLLVRENCFVISLLVEVDFEQV